MIINGWGTVVHLFPRNLQDVFLLVVRVGLEWWFVWFLGVPSFFRVRVLLFWFYFLVLKTCCWGFLFLLWVGGYWWSVDCCFISRSSISSSPRLLYSLFRLSLILASVACFGASLFRLRAGRSFWKAETLFITAERFFLFGNPAMSIFAGRRTCIIWPARTGYPWFILAVRRDPWGRFGWTGTIFP